eukprot:5614400-Prymnesium_polylepis.1
MLQLTPGSAFAQDAAQAEVYLPPTVGDAELDASLRDMQRRLRSAARPASPGSAAAAVGGSTGAATS